MKKYQCGHIGEYGPGSDDSPCQLCRVVYVLIAICAVAYVAREFL